MKKKIFAFVFSTIFIFGTVVGCGNNNGTNSPGKQGEDAEVTSENKETENDNNNENSEIILGFYWWGNQVRNDVTKRALDLYMEQNEGVVIKPEFSDWGGYWDKLAAMTAGGNMPDIVQQDYSFLNQYNDSGQLADLKPFMDDGTIDISKVPESIIESGKIDDKIIALSNGSNAPSFAYDKAVVEEAGVTIPLQMTMNEFYEISEIIYEKTGKLTFFDTGINALQLYTRGCGSHMFEEFAEGDYSSSTKFYSLAKRFSDSPSAIPPEILTEKDPGVIETKPIIDGTTWNDFSFSNQYISISEATGRDIGITMIPIDDDATTQPMFLKPSQFFSIAETSDHKEEAAKVLDYITNSIECNKILKAERGIPINTEVAEALKAEVDPTFAVVFDYINEVGKVATPIDDPDPNGKGEIEQLINRVGEDLRYGEVTADEAAKNVVDQSKSILESSN